MLFLAATINYVDRQVIGLLKPTLQQQFGWSEMDYADIIFAFQLAYAIGLCLCRPADRSHRHEARLRAGAAALERRRHRPRGSACFRRRCAAVLATVGLRIRFGRRLHRGPLRWDLARSVIFRVDQDRRRVVSEARAGPGYRHLQFRHERRRAGHAVDRAVDHLYLRLEVGVCRDRRARIAVARGLAAVLWRSGHASARQSRGACAHPERSAGRARAHTVAVARPPPADVGVRGRQVRHRSDLVALPLLDPRLFAPAARHRPAVDGAPAGRHLFDCGRGQHWRGMDVVHAAEARLEHEPRAQDGDARVRARGRADGVRTAKVDSEWIAVALLRSRRRRTRAGRRTCSLPSDMFRAMQSDPLSVWAAWRAPLAAC